MRRQTMARQESTRSTFRRQASTTVFEDANPIKNQGQGLIGVFPERGKTPDSELTAKSPSELIALAEALAAVAEAAAGKATTVAAATADLVRIMKFSRTHDRGNRKSQGGFTGEEEMEALNSALEGTIGENGDENIDQVIERVSQVSQQQQQQKRGSVLHQPQKSSPKRQTSRLSIAGVSGGGGSGLLKSPKPRPVTLPLGEMLDARDSDTAVKSSESQQADPPAATGPDDESAPNGQSTTTETGPAPLPAPVARDDRSHSINEQKAFLAKILNEDQKDEESEESDDDEPGSPPKPKVEDRSSDVAKAPAGADDDDASNASDGVDTSSDEDDEEEDDLGLLNGARSEASAPIMAAIRRRNLAEQQERLLLEVTEELQNDAMGVETIVEGDEDDDDEDDGGGDDNNGKPPKKNGPSTSFLVHGVTVLRRRISGMKQKMFQHRLIKATAESADGELAVHQGRMMISCSSRESFLWDIWTLCLVVYVTVTLPIILCFEDLNDGGWYYVNYMVDIFFIIDLMINFRTTFVEEATKEEIWDAKEIAINYVFKGRNGSWFPMDLIMSIPDTLIGNQESNGSSGSDEIDGDDGALEVLRVFQLFRMLRLVKIFRLARIFKIKAIADLEISGAVNPSVVRMVKLLGILLVVWHLASCTYWAVSLKTDADSWSGVDGTEAWTPRFDLADADLKNKYLAAFHWALMATQAEMTTPQTSEQTLFSVVVLFIGLLVNASVVGSVASLMENMDQNSNARKQLMDDVNEYLRFRKVPKDLCRRVRSFYSYVFSCGHLASKDKMFDELPEKLKLQLSVCLKKRIIEQVPLFRHLSPKGALTLINHLQPMIVMPDDLIVKEGDIGDRMFFLTRGKVRCFQAPGAVAENLPEVRRGTNVGAAGDRRKASIMTGGGRSSMAIRRQTSAGPPPTNPGMGSNLRRLTGFGNPAGSLESTAEQAPKPPPHRSGVRNSVIGVLAFQVDRIIDRAPIPRLEAAPQDSPMNRGKILQPGSYFGEIALLSLNARRTSNVMALTFSELHFLLADDFDTMGQTPEGQQFVDIMNGVARCRLVQNAEDSGAAEAGKRGGVLDSIKPLSNSSKMDSVPKGSSVAPESTVAEEAVAPDKSSGVKRFVNAARFISKSKSKLGAQENGTEDNSPNNKRSSKKAAPPPTLMQQMSFLISEETTASGELSGSGAPQLGRQNSNRLATSGPPPALTRGASAGLGAPLGASVRSGSARDSAPRAGGPAKDEIRSALPLPPPAATEAEDASSLEGSTGSV